jgi:porin
MQGVIAVSRFGDAFRQRSTAKGALALLALLLLIAPAIAQEAGEEVEGGIPGIPEGSIASSLPRHLADPGGARSRLANHGITFGLNYIGEVWGNPSGGIKQSTHYIGLLEGVVEVDMEKAIGWHGLSFFTNLYWIHGSSITASNIGSLMPVSFIEALPATRVFEFYLDQKLFDDKVSIRFGQLAADAEFLVSEGGGLFINGTWGWPSIAAEDLPGGGPAYPLATPGVRLGLYPTENTALLVALYNGDPAPPCAADDPQICNKHGFEWEFTNKPLLFAELQHSYHQGAGQLPGTIKIGGWNHFGNFETLREPVGIIDGDYGLYAIIDQMIYRLPGEGDPKGVSIFGTIAGAPSNRNLVDFYFDVGLTFSGMISHRPNDTFGIALGYTGISDDAVTQLRADGEPATSDYEAVLELVYNAEIVPGLIVSPDFQYFWNPGATEPIPDAAVFGLRTVISY